MTVDMVHVRHVRIRARTANDHATVPPRSVMNSRRVIRSPRRCGQGVSAEQQGSIRECRWGLPGKEL